MQWAQQRQLLFAFITLIVLVVLALGSYFIFFYKTPTCFDGIQNQEEKGVDCDGSCSKLCQQPNVTALWSRSVYSAPGLYHAVALIKNPDTAAQGSFPYKVSIFDNENILITTREGVLQLAPGEVASLFEPNVHVGERTPGRTFVDIGTGRWERAEREPLPVRVQSWSFDAEELRLTAFIENPTASNVGSVEATALLFDTEGVLVAASRTTLEGVTARESATAVFTWSESFGEPARIDIMLRVR